MKPVIVCTEKRGVIFGYAKRDHPNKRGQIKFRCDKKSCQGVEVCASAGARLMAWGNTEDSRFSGSGDGSGETTQ